jgi:hypothetical protein
MSKRLERVRAVFERYPGIPLYGLDVAAMARCWWIAPVYAELARLEQAGVIKSGWESGEYPRRRFYWLPAPARQLPELPATGDEQVSQ